MERVKWSLHAISLCVLLWGVAGQYEWQIRDAFDEVRGKIEKVSGDNCFIAHLDDLYLPEDSVSHHPDVKEININPVLPNRTAMLHLQNMAVNRAFFWSYILQSRFIRPAINDTYDPGMMYYFLSSVADVSANPYINASSIYFSPNMSYTSSYKGFFNKTMPRFAPRAFRADDSEHLQKISTMNMFHVEDLGAFDSESLSKDYTSELYKINEWYKRWLPDRMAKRYDTKTMYQVEIRYANNTNETFTFHGPPGNDEDPGPVYWTRPYFDCGRLNKWLVAAVSPVADIYPRHTQFRHIEYPTYTAAVVMELDYDRIDINQCPPSLGNDRPNRFASTARCKKTTECEPLHGWGFRRGGYQCHCAPGYHLPSLVRRPYLGKIIERATSDQYSNNFDCKKIERIQPLPFQWEKAHPSLRAIYMDRYYEYVNATSGPSALHTERVNVDEVLNFIRGVQPNNCSKYNPTDLFLNGDIAFGHEEQFENQARMAVRLANFISAFLQVSDPEEVFSGNRVADKPLTEDQIIGETLAIVIGDSKIWSAGTYWDRNKFTSRTYFAPFAYKTELDMRKYKLEDLARLNKTEEAYTNKPWFQFLKQRWSTNFDSLEKFYLKMKIRDDEIGKYLKKFERFPTYYRAANLKHGYWTRPYYDCDGHVKQWVITYAAPFFGWDSVKVKLEFKGVVAVTMDLMSLDINQCPDKYYVPNAFKGTDKCDRSSTYCVPIRGRGFDTGGYKCECLQGFEYPFEDPITYYDGQIVEAEFQNIIADKATRIDMFKCRLAGEIGSGEGTTTAQPINHVPVTAELNNTVDPSSAQTAEQNADTTPAINEVNVKDNGDCQQREQELLQKIEQLEKVKNERTKDGVKLELKVRDDEIDLLKARVRNLETELQAALSEPTGKNHEMIENIKQQHEQFLSKACGMIFDKIEMVKNQELQIETLTTQVQSLEDIHQLTKDLLEIKNSEVKAMEELRQKYEQRVQTLVSENAKLKEIAALKAGQPKE